jgi:hypothetical protein
MTFRQILFEAMSRPNISTRPTNERSDGRREFDGINGFGEMHLRKLVCAGARVAICARDREELERAAEELRACGVADLQADVCDVRDVECVRSWIGRHSSSVQGD